MHSAAKRNFERFLISYKESLNQNKTLKVLDLGSQSLKEDWVTIKSILKSNNLKFEYTGVDLEPGLNVDHVLDDIYSFGSINSNTYDLITATSVFEHIEFFWLTYLEIIRILKPTGLLYINTPSNGDFHRWPVDCWRFYPDSANALINWGNRNNYSSILLETFTSKQYLECGWSDQVAIILKDKNFLTKYKNRIIFSYKDFYNGIDENKNLIQFSNKTEDHKNFGYRLYYRIRKKLQKLKIIN